MSCRLEGEAGRLELERTLNALGETVSWERLTDYQWQHRCCAGGRYERTVINLWVNRGTIVCQGRNAKQLERDLEQGRLVRPRVDDDTISAPSQSEAGILGKFLEDDHGQSRSGRPPVDVASTSVPSGGEAVRLDLERALTALGETVSWQQLTEYQWQHRCCAGGRYERTVVNFWAHRGTVVCQGRNGKQLQHDLDQARLEQSRGDDETIPAPSESDVGMVGKLLAQPVADSDNVSVSSEGEAKRLELERVLTTLGETVSWRRMTEYQWQHRCCAGGRYERTVINFWANRGTVVCQGKNGYQLELDLEQAGFGKPRVGSETDPIPCESEVGRAGKLLRGELDQRQLGRPATDADNVSVPLEGEATRLELERALTALGETVAWQAMTEHQLQHRCCAGGRYGRTFVNFWANRGTVVCQGQNGKLLQRELEQARLGRPSADLQIMSVPSEAEDRRLQLERALTALGETVSWEQLADQQWQHRCRASGRYGRTFISWYTKRNRSAIVCQGEHWKLLERDLEHARVGQLQT